MIFHFFGLRIEIVRAAPGPRHVVVVAAPQLTEDELTAACRVADTNPLWCAVHQLIDRLEYNCQQKQWIYLENNSRLLGYIGGAEHLEQLRDDLVARRDASLGTLRRTLPKEKP
jgi:hypothetical protein